MLYLDLDELDELDTGRLLAVNRPGLLSFRRQDYRGSAQRGLKDAVLDDVQSELGFRPDGPVRLLTQVRSLGYVFNPVSFYYCFAAGGRTLAAVVAEITNTPWNERHVYVVPAGANGAADSFDKAFHVSPFFPLNQLYDWRFSPPGERLSVEMKNIEQGKLVFWASLRMKRRALTRANLWRVALLHPLMSWRVHLAIYWQAARLWLKRTPLFSHPKQLPQPGRCPHQERIR
jgi:DUF1365 family protein